MNTATLHAERMARADGCPACLVNNALPAVVTGDGNGGFYAHYSCPCGHDWITGWRD